MAERSDRGTWARGILSPPVDEPRSRMAEPTRYRQVEAQPGLVVTHRGSRFRGRIIRVERDGGVTLRSLNTGLERVFRLAPGGFDLDGESVTLVRARPAQARTGPQRTASGSVAVPGARARMARRSRVLVEGIHDAELVEKVWGDDLRVEGVVVERLDGIDLLDHVIDAFEPGPQARLGVLVDHLVPGSKEARIAASLEGPFVRITGTPYVDVWQAIKPSVAGIPAWPTIPKGQPWKEGMCRYFGEPNPGRLWKRLLSQVDSYADLEPALVGAVESLIDFVTETG